MLRRQMRKLKPISITDEGLVWKAPHGWREVVPGIYEPPGYTPSPWELRPPNTLTTPQARAAEYVKCARSLPYFAFRYCWTLHVDDPSHEGGYRRVPAYPYLREFFEALQTPQNELIEKSRQMIMSWAVMVAFLWDITFHDNWSNLAISKKEKLVDDGGLRSTPNKSLFGKVRVMHERLPSFLHHRFEFVKLRITNLDRHSTLTGESGQSDAGRSGNFNRLLVDEAGYVPNGESIFKAARQACKRGLILLSTPNGKSNVHARIRHTPHTTFRIRSYHWSQHPDKSAGLSCECGWQSEPGKGIPSSQFNAHQCLDSGKPKHATSPWYRRECSDLRPDQVGSELDLSYETSVRGRVYGSFRSTLTSVGGHVVDHETFRRRLKVGHDRWSDPLGPMREGETLEDYRYRYLTHALDPHLPVFVAWDFGIADPTVILLGQEVSPDGPIVRWLDSYRASNQGWRHFHQYIVGLWMRAWSEVGGDRMHSFQHYGDPYGKNRDSELKSWISNLAGADPQMIVKHHERGVGGTLAEWLDYIDDQYRFDRVQISSWDTLLIDATTQYHFPIDEETGEPLPGKHDPVHDQWSHPCDAKRYAYKFRYGHLLGRSNIASGAVVSMLAAGAGRATVERADW